MNLGGGSSGYDWNRRLEIHYVWSDQKALGNFVSISEQIRRELFTYYTTKRICQIIFDLNYLDVCLSTNFTVTDLNHKLRQKSLLPENDHICPENFKMCYNVNDTHSSFKQNFRDLYSRVFCFLLSLFYVKAEQFIEVFCWLLVVNGPLYFLGKRNSLAILLRVVFRIIFSHQFLKT